MIFSAISKRISQNCLKKISVEKVKINEQITKSANLINYIFDIIKCKICLIVRSIRYTNN